MSLRRLLAKAEAEKQRLAEGITAETVGSVAELLTEVIGAIRGMLDKRKRPVWSMGYANDHRTIQIDSEGTAWYLDENCKWQKLPSVPEE